MEEVMGGLNEAREQAIAYEHETAEAQEELEAFQAANGDSLEAIKDEYDNYKQHPLWQEHSDKQARTDEPALNYGEWYYQNWASEESPGPDFSWQGKVLFSGTPGGYGYKGHRAFNSIDPDTSILPLNVEEFDRRATIAGHIGEVATMLRAHHGEPIVSIANYPGILRFKRKNEDQDDYSFSYTTGKVTRLAKTRAIVGSIGEPCENPVFTETEPKSSSEDSEEEHALRLKLADNTVGTISAYSLPASKRQLKQQTVRPFYNKYRGSTGGYKYKNLPLGNSVIGNFPLDQLRGHDLMIIDGPHQAAADHEFSDDIVLHRPKQKIKTDAQLIDQEVAVTPGRNTKLYEASIISEDGEIVLPSFRHNTIWLVGTTAIEAHLQPAILGSIDSVSMQRRTNEAILRATRDMVELAGNGQFAKELAA